MLVIYIHLAQQTMQRMGKMTTFDMQTVCGIFYHDNFKSILINRIKSLGFNRDYILDVSKYDIKFSVKNVHIHNLSRHQSDYH